ncbi:endonuclease/exonuclease/phosphatase family protein [Streptomyces sp. SP17BM10]|uniref:endonuclease/exonuclease/phosphatase family protein n=1 Tax=Streptomyces sp. SP17BM10 TaxID=3002530 RepID=UPI002E7A8D8B|nr:endonuclease/exonuclease/phosphatase family protein [Streptomyces sp. SP17BM10]MEE1781470.1 endonuclease/exonuclease/phosphatase family protein [Streptomyces sp. SP17BM10]
MTTTQRVRLATFNVLHGRPVAADGRPASMKGMAAPERPLCEAVTALEADVVALQEVDRLQERSGGVDQAAAVALAVGAGHWRYASALHGHAVLGRGWILDPSRPGLRVYGPDDVDPDAGGPSHGVALLSRLPVRAWQAARLAPAPIAVPLRIPGKPGLVWSRDRPRAALAAVVEGRRGPFTVVAAHLSTVPGQNVRQLLFLRRWIAGLPRPHVLLGDLNLVGALPRTVLNAAELLAAPHDSGQRNGAWRDAVRARTYPSHRPLVQFDHILTNGVAAVPDARTSRSPVSDHRPLTVELPL